jgi:hypothetical protein
VKLFKSTLLALVAVATLTASRPSQAGVAGLVAFSASVNAAGLVIYGGATVGGLASFVAASKSTSPATKVGLIALGVALLGFVALDDEQGLSFNEVSEQQAAQLGLSASEMESFNSEIDQVNALSVHVTSQMVSLSSPTVEDSVAAWGSVHDSVSPEAFSAMQKITAQLYK